MDLDETGVLEGEPPLPGFRLPLAELFTLPEGLRAD